MIANKTPTKTRKFLLKTITQNKKNTNRKETKFPHGATHPFYNENILFK